MSGNELYHRTISFDYGDEDRRALMEKVWTVTPWMVNAFTGSINDPREREIAEWCRAEFGDEAWPIHGRPGSWQRGSATIHGWTFLGFDTPEKLAAFEARWPDPAGRAALEGDG
jgi:hypothetical protein